MPNNVPVGQRFFVAKQTILFSAIAAINSTSPRNINFIYWLDNNSIFKLYEPGNPFSTLNGFVAGESYQIAANVALDLTAYLGVPAGGGGTLVLEQFTATQGQKSFTTVGVLPAQPNVLVIRNDYPQGQLFDPAYAPARVSDHVVTANQDFNAGDLVSIPTLQYLL